jgi:hypothetical protein
VEFAANLGGLGTAGPFRAIEFDGHGWMLR